MQIKIEIDLRPDELRRFLGLPDVAALQEDVVHFLREKLEQAEQFNAGAFVKTNLKTLSRGNPLAKWLNAASPASGSAAVAPAPKVAAEPAGVPDPVGATKAAPVAARIRPAKAPKKVTGTKKSPKSRARTTA